MLLNKLLRKKSTVAAEHDPEDIHSHSLHKVLTTKDLTFFGIAAIIGAGIFSSIGSACSAGGPAVIFLFIICAIACGFTAMCYAEFAARVPMSGSAYTYAYVSFGELFAWIIGWALLMEYSIGNIYVAYAWSGYFTNLVNAIHIGSWHMHIPSWLTINYTEAHQGIVDANLFNTGYLDYLHHQSSDALDAFKKWLESTDVVTALQHGATQADLVSAHFKELYYTPTTAIFLNSPTIGGLHIVFDLPAVAINIIITWLVLVGVKESKNVSNLMVMIKLAIIALIIIVGVFYIDIDNWHPFMPHGFKGVMSGVAAVFFAFIGFDAVSTLAEECKNPQRDLPRGMILSLLISTVIFVVLTLVLTGMVSYTELNVSDPLAHIFELKGIKWMLLIVSVSAVVAMTSVILVFQMGQPRIWMTMSRDGLMPKRFSKIHPKYKTPAFATIVTGLVVGIPIFFTDRNFILDFTSIGTLFAFTLVCGGVLVLPRQEKREGKFNLPYVNSQYIVPALVVGLFVFLFTMQMDYMRSLFSINSENAVVNIPMLIFFLICIFMAIMSFIRKFSLIPVLGFLSCMYLFTGFNVANWKWFFCWMIIGLVVYFSYGFRKSKLNTANK